MNVMIKKISLIIPLSLAISFYMDAQTVRYFEFRTSILPIKKHKPPPLAILPNRICNLNK